MLTLYYSPLACSMASHVVLEEAGASFSAVEVNIFKGEHRRSEYLAINPQGKVPALRFDDGRVLLETVAILQWIGAAYPDAALLGASALDQALTIATCAWLSSAVHPTFATYVHPERFSDDEAAHAALKSRAKATFWSYLHEIDRNLADRQWVMGSRFTVADPYALVFYSWGLELKLPIGDLLHLTAMKERLIHRPAARRALERENSRLLTL